MRDLEDVFRIVWLDLLTLYTQYSELQRYRYLHTLQFTVTHPQGLSVFISRILATDFITVSPSLQITHEVFSHPNSFFAIILQLPIPKTTQFSFEAHILVGWRLETQNLLNWTLLCNHFARTTQETQPLYCWEGVSTALLLGNGSYPIVACVISCSGNVFESLPSSEHLFWLHYSGFWASCRNIILDISTVRGSGMFYIDDIF
jgi:hypothetical protein